MTFRATLLDTCRSRPESSPGTRRMFLGTLWRAARTAGGRPTALGGQLCCVQSPELRAHRRTRHINCELPRGTRTLRRPMPATGAHGTQREVPQGCAPNHPPHATTARSPHCPPKMCIAHRQSVSRPTPNQPAWPHSYATYGRPDSSAPKAECLRLPCTDAPQRYHAYGKARTTLHNVSFALLAHDARTSHETTASGSKSKRWKPIAVRHTTSSVAPLGGACACASPQWPVALKETAHIAAKCCALPLRRTAVSPGLTQPGETGLREHAPLRSVHTCSARSKTTWARGGRPAASRDISETHRRTPSAENTARGMNSL